MLSRAPLIAALSLLVVAAACATPPAASPTGSVPPPSPAAAAPTAAPSPSPEASVSEEPEPTAVPTPSSSVVAGADTWVVPCQEQLATVELEETRPAPAAIVPKIILGDETTGVLIASAPLPDDASSLFLGSCLWQAGSTRPTVNAGVVGLAPNAALDLERVIRTQEAPIIHVLGGRVTDEVTKVVVTLADGTTQDATVQDGHWLAWWTGPTGSSEVVATDAAGTTVLTVPFDDMAP